MQFGLKDEQLGKIILVFAEFKELKSALLFGSRAKGNFKPSSDIDIAIKCGNFSFDDLLKLNNSLDELNLPYKFDILVFEKIKDKELIGLINRIGIVIYEKEIN